MRRPRLLVAGAAVLAAAAAATAHAHPPGPALSVAIEALRTVNVSYSTGSGFTELEADAVVLRLAGSDDVAVALVAPSAILPGGPEATARDVAAHLHDGRAYVVASGGRLGAWAGADDAGEVRALVAAVRGQPPALAVAELASRLAERARRADAGGPPAWLWPLVAAGALLVLLAAAFALRARRARPRAATPRP